MSGKKDDVPAFHMTIVGATALGKTFFLLKLLEKRFMGHFNNIWLICPTFSKNETYQNWKYSQDPDLIPIECRLQDVEVFLREVVEASRERGNYADGNRNLLILDDVSSSLAVKNRTSALVESAFSSRHDGLSVIVLTQQFKSISKPWRENTSDLVFFYSPNKKDTDAMFDEYLGHISPKEKKEIVNTLATKKYFHLYVTLMPTPVICKLGS